MGKLGARGDLVSIDKNSSSFGMFGPHVCIFDYEHENSAEDDAI